MTKDRRKDFYRVIARGLDRPLFSVYRRVLRMYDQKNHIGKYTPDEITKLREWVPFHSFSAAVFLKSTIWCVNLNSHLLDSMSPRTSWPPVYDNFCSLQQQRQIIAVCMYSACVRCACKVVFMTLRIYATLILLPRYIFYICGWSVWERSMAMIGRLLGLHWAVVLGQSVTAVGWWKRVVDTGPGSMMRRWG